MQLAIGGAVLDDRDDLADARTFSQRLLRSTRTWLAALVVVALAVPAVTSVGDELAFRRSGAEVVATLAGERRGADAAGTVLLVRAIGCDGRTSTGTAFVVATSDGPALVTNRHVVDDARVVGLRGLDGEPGPRVAGTRLSVTADVAVLDVEDQAALPPALSLADGAPTPGDPIRLVGFPAARPFTDAGEVAEVADDRLLLDVEVRPGASGSPVVDREGRLVGQVHAVTGAGLGVATAAERLVAAAGQARPASDC